MIRQTLAAVAENIAAPLAVYGLLVLLGVAPVWALLGAAGVSVVVVGYRWVRERRLNALGALVGVQFLLSIAVAAITGDARLMLAKEALTTGVAAAAFAVSLATSRPLLALIHRDFTTSADAFDGRWAADAAFRADHRRVTTWWIAGLTVSAAGIIVFSYLPPLTVAVVVTQVLPVPVYLALIGATQRRFARIAPELHRPVSA